MRRFINSRHGVLAQLLCFTRITCLLSALLMDAGCVFAKSGDLANYKLTGNKKQSNSSILNNDIGRLSCDGNKLEYGEYTLGVKVKYFDWNGKYLSNIHLSGILSLISSSSISEPLFLKKTTQGYQFCSASGDIQSLGDYPRISLVLKNEEIGQKLEANDIARWYSDNGAAISIDHQGVISHKSSKVTKLKDLYKLLMQAESPHFLNNFTGIKEEVTPRVFNGNTILIEGKKYKPSNNTGVPSIIDSSTQEEGNSPAKGSLHKLTLGFPPNFPVRDISKHIKITPDKQEAQCSLDSTVKDNTIEFQCTSAERQFSVHIDGFEPLTQLTADINKGGKVDLSSLLKQLKYAKDYRGRVELSINRQKTENIPLSGKPYNWENKAQIYIYNDKEYQYSITLNEVFDPPSTPFIAKLATTSSKEKMVDQDTVAINKPVSSNNTRWIQLPEGLYNALRKSGLDSIALYNADTNIPCHHEEFGQDEKNKIYFSDCDNAPQGDSIQFKLSIDGFQSRKLDMQRYTDLGEFNDLKLKTEVLSFNGNTNTMSFEWDQINSEVVVSPLNALCRETVNITYKDIIQQLPVETKNDCQALIISYPRGWGEAKIAKENSTTTEKSGTCHTAGKNLNCDYKTTLGSTENIKLEWQGGSISAFVPADSMDVFKISRLMIKAPIDTQSILDSATSNSLAPCQQQAKFKINNITACLGNNKASDCQRIANTSSLYGFYWAHPQLPGKLYYQLTQTSSNLGYKTQSEHEIDITAGWQLPSLEQLISVERPISISLSYRNAKNQNISVPYNSDHELLFYNSKEACLSGEDSSIQKQTGFSLGDIENFKLAHCNTSLWAKVMQSRETNITQCAEGKLFEQKLEFTLRPTTINYAKQRWLIILSASRGLSYKSQGIKNALTTFLKDHRDAPITVITLGAQPRTLLRAEDKPSINKIQSVVTAMDEVRHPIIDLEKISAATGSRVKPDFIKRIVYITDSNTLDSTQELTERQERNLSFLQRYNLTIVTLDGHCDVWENNGIPCHTINNMATALNTLTQ